MSRSPQADGRGPDRRVVVHPGDESRPGSVPDHGDDGLDHLAHHSIKNIPTRKKNR